MGMCPGEGGWSGPREPTGWGRHRYGGQLEEPRDPAGKRAPGGGSREVGHSQIPMEGQASQVKVGQRQRRRMTLPRNLRDFQSSLAST